MHRIVLCCAVVLSLAGCPQAESQLIMSGAELAEDTGWPCGVRTWEPGLPPLEPCDDTADTADTADTGA